MLKLYRRSGAQAEYWETWEGRNGVHTVHWGELGTRGQSKTVRPVGRLSAVEQIQKEVDERVSEGFAPIPPEDHSALLVEYAIQGMGTKEDLEKRHRLEERMNEALGWTGLGACDGGSIGSGTMEVCNFVVDVGLAKKVIAEELNGTEFGDYTRIFVEGTE